MEDDIVVELGLTAGQAQTLNWVLSVWLHANRHYDITQVENDVRAIQQAVEGI